MDFSGANLMPVVAVVECIVLHGQNPPTLTSGTEPAHNSVSRRDQQKTPEGG